MSAARRVAVVLPYLTAYRLPFLDRLRAELAAHSVELTVAHGNPTGLSAARQSALSMPGAVPLGQRAFRVAGRELIWHGGLGELARRSDALVLPQSLHHLRLYPLLATRPERIGLWGHGRTHVSTHGRPEQWAKAALTRRAGWFFAYTDAGRAYAEAAGLPRQRITVVRNSLDTAALTAARDAVTEDEAARLRRRYGLTQGRTGLYVGGLDELKRIPFLLDAAARIAARVPGFKLLVAGDGEQRGLVEASPFAAYAGHVGVAEKARLGAVSDVMLVPGAVGLCAVDSFALRTPLVTTEWPYHGPEFGYLTHGRNALVARDETYADQVAELLTRPRLLSGLRRACRCDAGHYTVEGMATRFAEGIEGLLTHGT
ncbi:glycosyltransferase family 4 protein [Streptomyces sp. NBC_01304]|uniref:glycosyltransferase family 4 protein n=1 Tax=Streptomyces sp. NBC_01304 TaxID=2903818 RepID=UPI002E15EB7F|nr:glycosyltransferase family 4 protein [Streptomyces sp. NBC_01304]